MVVPSCSLTHVIVSILCVLKAVSSCSLNSELRGNWGLWVTYDNINYDNRFNMTMMEDILLGYQLQQFPVLVYRCYDYSDNMLTFRSDVTLFFETYSVRIFFCWYMIRRNSETYDIVELTDPVFEASEEHAKAYLEEDSTQPKSAICENSFTGYEGLAPPFKQLRKIVSPTWNQ